MRLFRALLHRHAFERVAWHWTMDEGVYWTERCRCGVLRKDHRPTVAPAGWTAPAEERVR